MLWIAIVSELEQTGRGELQAEYLCLRPHARGGGWCLESGDSSAVKMKNILWGRRNDSSERNMLTRVVRGTRTHVRTKRRVGACACNPSTGKAEAGGYLRLAGKFQATKE